MINTRQEHVIPLREAPAYIASVFKHRPHYSVVYRWTRKGVHGVRLESIRLGNKVFTSHEAIDRFVNASQAAREAREEGCDNVTSMPRHRSEKARQKAIVEARKKLAG